MWSLIRENAWKAVVAFLVLGALVGLKTAFEFVIVGGAFVVGGWAVLLTLLSIFGSKGPQVIVWSLVSVGAGSFFASIADKVFKAITS